jgi:hypothetical protein
MHRVDKGIMIVLIGIAGLVGPMLLSLSARHTGPGAMLDYEALFIWAPIALASLAAIIIGLYLMFGSPPRK